MRWYPGPILLKHFLAAQFSITAVVLLLTMVGFGEGLIVNFYFGQCIGITTFAITSYAAIQGRPLPPAMRMCLHTLAMAAGAFFGILLAFTLAGISADLLTHRDRILQIMVLTIAAGVMYRYVLDVQQRIYRAKVQIHKEKIDRLTIEKQAAETHLRCLQAQIEPHFLFNTLSNILSLLETRPDSGKTMLRDLTRYLRSALSKSRSVNTTLGEEVTLIRAYLDIFRIRMGERLTYDIEMPTFLEDETFPPMLIQPLVENAILHGIEPKIDGGHIRVRCSLEDRTLVLEVADTGIGFTDPGGGMGPCQYPGTASRPVRKRSPVDSGRKSPQWP